MSKYSSEDREALAAAGKRLGLGEHDSKVTDLREKTARPVTTAKTKKRPAYRREPESECCERMIKQHALKHLAKAEEIPPYDVSKPTRYPEVVMWEKAGGVMLNKILRRYAHVMKPQGITANDFRMWREHFLLMTPEQLGALVRVSARTIRNWENGESEIPFSMWWVMHVTMQDPEYFLTRPGFHDFYIEYVEGNAYLCSSTYPEIRWTSTDLYFNRCALNEVLALRAQIKEQDERIGELEAENTQLRQMLKTEGVTGELQAMQDQIAALMKRIQTADVMPFQTTTETPPTTNLSYKAAGCRAIA